MSQYGTLVQSTHEIPKGSTFSIKRVGQTDGYDGHCLRAFGYFGENMPDIVDTVESINSIESAYPNERQDGKAPTFALTISALAA